MPVHRWTFAHEQLFKGVNALIFNTKIEQFFVNLTNSLIFPQKNRLLETVMFGGFMYQGSNLEMP